MLWMDVKNCKFSVGGVWGAVVDVRDVRECRRNVNVEGMVVIRAL